MFSLQYFTDNSMFRETPKKKTEEEEKEDEDQNNGGRVQQASPTIQSQSSVDLSNLDNRDRLRRVMSVPDEGTLPKKVSSQRQG